MKNSATNEEIGESKVSIDDLVDTELSDLAKEFCVCLSRQYILQGMIEEKVKKGKKREDAIKELDLFTEYSGIIRF